MPDLLEHLTEEHRKAEQLMRTLLDSDEGPERVQTLADLREALTKHMAVEEQFLYPIVQRTLGEEPEQEAENEHQLAREGLEKLSELVSEPGFGAAVEMLQGGVGHHVKEEEQEIFPKLRQQAGDEVAALDPEELEQRVETRGSSRSGGQGPGPTKDELYQRAQEADIPGRSHMTKDELAQALETSDA
jgi:iron-sulfur cluster repair protein YtfE (RIC family)